MKVPDSKETAAHWLAQAEEEAHRAQHALDDLESLNVPDQWGEVDVARQRSELITARDEYLREATHWRDQLRALTDPTGAASIESPGATTAPSR